METVEKAKDQGCNKGVLSRSAAKYEAVSVGSKFWQYFDVRKRKTKLQRFFSLNQHYRRRGAKKHIVSSPDYQAMKTRLLPASIETLEPGSAKSIEAHFNNLQRDFGGQSELLFYHAKLIVLIRRGYQTRQTFVSFEKLWIAECEFMASNLNLRWLVSASDTFADHSTDKTSQAIAILASTLANTVKLYESEIELRSGFVKGLAQDTAVNQPAEIPILFDGMPRFNPGRDDTLRNQRWRLEGLFNQGIQGRILQEIYDRLKLHQTAYSRLQEFQDESYLW